MSLLLSLVECVCVRLRECVRAFACLSAYVRACVCVRAYLLVCACVSRLEGDSELPRREGVVVRRRRRVLVPQAVASLHLPQRHLPDFSQS